MGKFDCITLIRHMACKPCPLGSPRQIMQMQINILTDRQNGEINRQTEWINKQTDKMDK